MTTEEKAKAYDEAIERAKSKIKNDKDHVLYEKDITDIFPALEESEDERIRKALIKYYSFDKDGGAHALDNITPKQILAWLEKAVTPTPQDWNDYKDKPVELWNVYVQGIANGMERGKEAVKKHPQDYGLEKQGEQKPTDKVEPFDEYEGLTDFERTLADICIGWIGQELGWKQYIKDNADVLLKIAIKKFNSIQDAPFERKPIGWSKEDERIYQSIMDDTVQENQLNDEQTNWLKDIKYRYFPQPKSDWSEEDRKKIIELIGIFESAVDGGNAVFPYRVLKDYIRVLKLCLHQSHWKPSDEQMKALQESIGIVGELTSKGECLKELVEQLKKLREK